MGNCGQCFSLTTHKGNYTMSISAKAKELGLILSKDENFNVEMDNAVIAKEMTLKGPFGMMIAAVAALSAQDALDELPVPGSKRVAGSNVPFDIREETSIGKNKKRTTKNISFYSELFESTSKGLELEANVESIKKADANDANAKKVHRDMQPHQREAELNRLRTAASIGRSTMLKAFRLHFQLEAIKEWPTIGVKLITEEETTSPIYIYEKPATAGEPATNFMRLGVNEFLTLRPWKAAEGVAEYPAKSFNALKYSKKKKGEAEPGGTVEPTFKSWDKAEEAFIDLATYMEKNGTKLGDYLTKAQTADERDTRITTICDLFVSIRPYVEPLLPRYEAIKEGKLIDAAASDKKAAA